MVLYRIIETHLVNFSEDVGEEAVCPVAGVGIEYSVQLHNTPVLGVYGVQLRGQSKSTTNTQILSRIILMAVTITVCIYIPWPSRCEY